MRANNRSFRLCESTLVENTRDVYDHALPIGNWRYTLQHDGTDDVRLEIHALDQKQLRWLCLNVQASTHQQASEAKSEGNFSIQSESELRFIFSSTATHHKIQYRCDVSPV